MMVLMAKITAALCKVSKQPRRGALQHGKDADVIHYDRQNYSNDAEQQGATADQTIECEGGDYEAVNSGLKRRFFVV
jgi:hypothetical protein